jgi:hypothetical protein
MPVAGRLGIEGDHCSMIAGRRRNAIISVRP